MAAAAVAVGADGLMIEVHPQPEKALSDGYQSLDFPQFAETMELCRRVADAVGKVMAPQETAVYAVPGTQYAEACGVGR
jgi:3-deoxy-7-phosphoheptulonate synthase